MIKIVSDNIDFDFLGKRKLGAILSIALFVLTIALLVTRGLNWGIDFTGGMLVQLQSEKEAPIAEIRESLIDNGFVGATLQEYGAPNEFLVRLPVSNSETEEHGGNISVAVASSVAAVAGHTDVRRTEFVGPQIGDELKEKGIFAILLAMGAILIYVSVRFEIRYAMGAVIALAHDVFLTVGFFALIQKEVSMPVLAALLTIIGYSLNDTIVVFDRVRENYRGNPKMKMVNVLNLSLNEMLNRTVMTSLTTLVVLLALYLFGGEVINGFALTLIFGVIVGTYSSVFVASPVVLWMERYIDKRPKEPGAEDIDYAAIAAGKVKK